MRGDRALRFGYAKDCTGGSEYFSVSTVDELMGACASQRPLDIVLDGQTNFDLKGKKLYVGSNKTIRGGIGTSILHGELRIQGQHNVELYHLRFRDPVGDGVTVKGSDLVHIMNCTFDAKNAGTTKHGGTADGAVDVVAAPEQGSRVTVAFCRFLRWHKCHLLGWSDAPFDHRIRFTAYRNRYNCGRRLPQVNQAYAHFRNCLIEYEDQCAASYQRASVWMDRCFIHSIKGRESCSEWKSDGKKNGYIGWSGCLYDDCKSVSYEKEKAKRAKAHWDTMPRLPKSWSSAKRIKAEAGMQYK